MFFCVQVILIQKSRGTSNNYFKVLDKSSSSSGYRNSILYSAPKNYAWNHIFGHLRNFKIFQGTYFQLPYAT